MKNNIKIKNQSGVYKITNKVNGKFYIGSSKNLSERFRSHLCTLLKGNSGCRILQAAVKKYGIENFEFSVVEVCDNYKEKEIEIFSLKMPDYNCIKETKIRREISEETKKKMSQSQTERNKQFPKPKGYKRVNYVRNVKTSIKVTHKDTNEILEFNSVKETCEYFKAHHTAIYNCITFGWKLKWKYKVEKIINK